MTIAELSPPAPLRLGALLLVIMILGLFDYRTGPDIGFSLFYLAPIVAAAWYFGTSSAMTAAAGGAAAWFVADYLAQRNVLPVTLWNALTRLVIYVALGALVARMRDEKARLQRANAELDAFTRSVSHDLRSPLLRIGRYAEMVERHGEHLDQEGKRYLATIAGTAAEGVQLVDDLLDFAQVAKTDLRRSTVNLGSIVARLQSELGESAGDRMIRWSVGPLPVIRGDAPMLEVALRNLIGNAVKFTRPRAEAVIEIGSYADGDSVVVYVRDNGVGFDPAFAHKLFGVFERLHGQGEFEGTGIGLALTERIIARHEGIVWAEGATDRGATFYMKIPVRP